MNDRRTASETITTRDEAHTIAVAAALGRLLVGGEVVALSGELGAGKTRFVKGLAAGLGVEVDDISSPTFVIRHDHLGRRLDLVHIDAWRLGGEDDLSSIGWDELRERSDLVIAVEWPERLGAALSDEAVFVRIDHGSPTERTITVEGDAALVHAWRRALHGTACRTCGRSLDLASPTAPFCSQRCRMADLGRWFAGEFRVSGPAPEDEGGE
ncbi:MAG: tRNA (adenosine(37)-N6)-threonylcarbamoyltransferase complex ATPase subunit type 1 TsaE [Phycisphaerales bacterium]